MKLKLLLVGALGGMLAAGAVGPAQAIPLLGGLQGSPGAPNPAGFGELAMPRNDDGSSNSLNLPFTINFFGQNFSSFFINNNGNITFGGPRGTFTPAPFPQTGNRPMIAPFWGDVDTRCASCGEVYVGGGTDTAGRDIVAATWHNVGYFSRSTNRTNSFQAIIRDRSDTGAGNFDIDFRYERLEWTTGDASGGSGGLGGTPAQAGFDAANGTDFFTLPGSRTAAVLDLQNNSNVSPTTPGLWTFAIRNGAPPDGSSPSNPLLPVVSTNGDFNFDFNVDLNQTIFIDPPVAIAYDYFIDSGPNVASVVVPFALPGGDDTFLLELPDGTDVVMTAGINVDLLTIDPLGYREFRISGIDVGEGLDPADPTAFVTGLTFVTAGLVSMRQVPVTINVPGAPVPAPATLLLLASGLVGLGLWRRVRRA